MESTKASRRSILNSIVILAGTLLLTYLNYNQYYQIVILRNWEGVPFGEASRWFYNSPELFGYYTLAKAGLYFCLFLISLYATITRRQQLLQIAGFIFLFLYLFTYFIQLF